VTYTSVNKTASWIYMDIEVEPTEKIWVFKDLPRGGIDEGHKKRHTELGTKTVT